MIFRNFHFIFLKLLKRNRKRRRKRRRETSMCGCLSVAPHWGPGLQPRHVPWLGIEPTTLYFAARAQSTQLYQPGQNFIFTLNKSYQHYTYYYGSYCLLCTNSVPAFPLTLPNKLIICIIIWFPNYIWGHCDSEKLNNFSKVLHSEIEKLEIEHNSFSCNVKF